MSKKLLHFRAALVLVSSMLMAVLGGGRVMAQGVTTSSINGVVTDDKGSELPGATVVAIHRPSGTRYGTTTNTTGRYTFPAVRIGGPYDITISYVGFQDQKRELLSADLGVPAVLNVKLSDQGNQLAEVVVTAGSIVDAERNGASTNFKRETFERLPTLNRSFQDFSVLTPQAGPGFSFGGRSNLYNNFSIDGATSNNVFGLSALPGGQSNSQPVSVDAIQEISVQLSPYDVSQGAFTGAGVNAVTRSGTNQVQGSVYYFTKNDALAGKKIAGNELPELQRPAFTYNNYGARIGGPIIKNKLFFFGNFERETATTPAVLYPYGQSTGGIPNQPGSLLADGTVNPETDLERLRTFLTTTTTGKTWTFDPGTYNNFNVPQQSTKFLAKIDWNISNNHKFTVRYNQLNAYRDVVPSSSGGFTTNPPGTRSNSISSIPFSNSYYRILNNLYSIFGELNSSFGNGKFANNLQVGYNVFRDTREQGGGGTVVQFPTVDILGPNQQVLTTIGPDPFTPNNRLDQDVIQVNDKFDAFVGNHTFTLGTANEFYKFYNVFTQVVNGIYQYNSISDFVNNATAPTTTNVPTRFYQQYSAVAGDPAPAANFKASQLGFYAQDAYSGIKNLRLTLGLRVDIPLFSQNSGLYRNEIVENLRFANSEQLFVNRLPATTPLFSPRVGFNWDVLGNKSLQVRGGAGIFTGRVPFVWISNQLSNNGVFFNTITAGVTTATNPVSLTTGAPNTTNTVNTPFNPNINAYVPTNLSTASTFAINVTAPNFKFPQVFRTNIGIDKTLPGGFVLTGELIYTKDINAVYIRDANTALPVGTLAGDGRPLYGTNLLRNTNITQALVQDNTDQGYALSLTGQIQKTTGRWNGSLAYTFTDSKDLNSQSGSTAGGLLNGNPYVTDINTPTLGYAGNWFPHRVVGYVGYRFNYLKAFATTLSLIYEGRSAGNFSYVYGGAPNGLTSSTNTNLIYVPRSQNEILLTTTNATDIRTPQQIWDQFNAYIEQDPYLKTRRGQYAERGAALLPWVNFLNFRLLQDIGVVTGKSRNSIQVSVELFNVLNFLNSEWGVIKSTARTSILGFSGYETPNTANGTTGRPIYTFATNADGSALSNSYVNNQGVSNGVTNSRWQLQVGLRYIFN